MPETEMRRLVLWRNTIQLFYEYKSIAFKGPFKCAGFRLFRIEPAFLDNEGKDAKPDITAINDSDNHWLCMELTLKSGPKSGKLEKYLTIHPEYLSDYGVGGIQSKPDVICSRLDTVDESDYCQIIVRSKFDVVNCANLNHAALGDCLHKARGSDLSRLPEITISLIPEVTAKPSELRQGIFDIIMTIFAPDSKGMTGMNIVSVGLERLSDKVDNKDKLLLVKKVIEQMDELVAKELKQYMEKSEDGTYRAKPVVNVKHHATREKIGIILHNWAWPQYIATTLKQFDTNGQSCS